jgi:hypothetical protein
MTGWREQGTGGGEGEAGEPAAGKKSSHERIMRQIPAATQSAIR